MAATRDETVDLHALTDVAYYSGDEESNLNFEEDTLPQKSIYTLTLLLSAGKLDQIETAIRFEANALRLARIAWLEFSRKTRSGATERITWNMNIPMIAAEAAWILGLDNPGLILEAILEEYLDAQPLPDYDDMVAQSRNRYTLVARIEAWERNSIIRWGFPRARRHPSENKRDS